MGITKTDFVRGMQCPKMLWLDHHKPEEKEIPPEIQDLLDRGNAYGDSLMGMFGPYTEVQEYYPGTKHPDKVRMAAKTEELFAAGTKIMLNAKELQELLGISQSSTYDLMHREDFPTLRINARLMVSRSNLIKWLTEHTDGAGNIDGQ